MHDTLPTIEWFESVRKGTAHSPDVLELNSAGGSVLHTRYWYDNELIEWHVGPPRHHSETPTVVELSWDQASSETSYWAHPFTQPLQRARVRAGGRDVELHTSSTFLERFAPEQPLPDASFRLEIECRGLALDPAGSHTYVLHLDQGRPEGRLDDPEDGPDIRISASVDRIMSWLSGDRLLTELLSEMTVEGEILMLGAVAGVFGISGGFEFPADLGPSTDALVSLVQDHRALLSDYAGVEFS